ncbi:unnamed protein product, partial [Effrenium voratum]
GFGGFGLAKVAFLRWPRLYMLTMPSPHGPLGMEPETVEKEGLASTTTTVEPPIQLPSAEHTPTGTKASRLSCKSIDTSRSGISGFDFRNGPPSEAGDSVMGSQIWTEHTPTKMYWNSRSGNGLLSEGALDEEYARERWLFIPTDKWVQVWTNLMHFMVLVSGFFTPMRYALLDPQDIFAFIVDCCLDATFAVDIIFTCNQAIWNPTGYITSRFTIIKAYWWSGRLLLDILATFPVDLVVEMMGGPTRLATGLGLLRLVRLYRLLVMFREMQQSDKTNLIVIMLAKFVTCILLSTHLSACLFWGLARDDEFAEDTWVAQGAPWLPQRAWLQRYITSLFWAVGTFKAGPSAGDLVPTSDMEKILACVVMMCNICLQTYLVSNLSALLTRADVGIYTMRKELRQLSVFSQTFSLPKNVKEQLQGYVRFKHSTDQELESSVMAMLPDLYRQRISSLLYSKLVREMDLFQGCAKRFLSQLHSSLTSNLYMSGHHLVYVDDSSSHLYIISEGEVLLSHHGQSVETRRNLETFSELAFLCRLPEPFDVSSKSLCRILSLNLTAWESAISIFPSDGVQVMENLIKISRRRRSEFPKNTNGSRIYKSIIRDAQTHIVHRRDMTTAALCFAAASGDVAEVKKLVTGQSPNCCDYDHRTPLHVAASKGQTGVISVLVDSKAQINAMDHFGRTPLMEACRQRQMSAARALHEAGALLGFGEAVVKDDDMMGYRPSQRSEESDHFIAEDASNVSDMTKEVHDPYAEAAELCAAASDPQQLWSCARKLMKRGAYHGFCEDGQTDDANATHAGQELCQAAFSGQNKYLNNLISLCGLSPDCCDYDRRTALMLACAEGNMDAAVTLIQVQADPHLKDRWGHSAMSEARDAGHYDLVAVLERLWRSQQKKREETTGWI